MEMIDEIYTVNVTNVKRLLKGALEKVFCHLLLEGVRRPSLDILSSVMTKPAFAICE